MAETLCWKYFLMAEVFAFANSLHIRKKTPLFHGPSQDLASVANRSDIKRGPIVVASELPFG